jgi:hypothetical protein
MRYQAGIKQSERSYINAFTHNVDRIVESGGTSSKAFDTLRTNWETYLHSTEERNGTTDLAALVATPKPLDADTITAHRERALLDHVETRTEIETVGEQVSRALETEYRATTAQANYQVAAQQFDKFADQLTRAHTSVDLDAAPETVLAGTKAQRDAYLGAGILPAQLDEALQTLAKAGALAGLNLDIWNDETSVANLIGLAADTRRAHVRRVWEAWQHPTSRLGRWGSLLATGATLRAATLEDFHPQREPRDMEIVTERVGVGIRQFQVDPEDADFEQRTSNAA